MENTRSNFDGYVIDLAKSCREQRKDRLDKEDQEKILVATKGVIKQLAAETGKILRLLNSIWKLRSENLSIRERSEEEAKIYTSFDSDPVLRTKLMEVAESPYYGKRDVESMQTKHLIDWLGFSEIGRILSNVLHISQSLKHRENTYGVNSDSFWLHSTGVGLCLEAFYEFLDENQKREIKDIFDTQDVEQINSYLYLIGLLHDIGKIVLSQKLFPLYEIVIEMQQGKDKNIQPISIFEVEKEFFNFTHVDLGTILLRGSLLEMGGEQSEKRFFGILIEAMKCHHDLDYNAGKYDMLGKLLFLANRFLVTDITIGKYGLALTNHVQIANISSDIGMPNLLEGAQIKAVCIKVENRLFDILRQQEKSVERWECKIDTISRQERPTKKYDVFISSTFEDLQAEKEAAIEALNQCGVTFKTMEFLGAAPKTPLRVSLETVAKCKAYIGIIGFQYGSIPDNWDISYTQLEYSKAKQENLARFIYIKDLNALVLAEFCEWDPEKLIKIIKFREELLKDKFSTTCFSFKNPDQLKCQIYMNIRDYFFNTEK